jgi:uncharacterized protein YbjT (DUF2867 family)
MDGVKRSGTVAITGASGQVGTLVGTRLRHLGNRVVPLGRWDDWEAGIEGSEVVVHLAGTLQPKGADTYRSANVETSERIARAASESGVERIVFLSYVGADVGSPNEYLASKAAAERILFDSGVPTTVLRCLHIYGPPDRPGPTASAFLASGRGPVPVPGSGKQRIAPLYVGDVCEAVTTATLARRAPDGCFDLGGPEAMSMDDFVRTLNGGDARILHLREPLARLLARLSPGLTPALIDLLLTDNVVTDPRGTAERFRVELRSVTESWGEAAVV